MSRGRTACAANLIWGICFTSLPKGCLMTSGTASPHEATKPPPYEAACYLVDLVQRKCSVL